MLNTYTANSKSKVLLNYGKSRIFLVIFFIIGIGVDFRTGVLGFPGPSINILELLTFFSFLLLLADSVIYPKLISYIINVSWNKNSFVLLYFLWIFFASIVGFEKLGVSFFIFRNIFPALIIFLLINFSTRSIGDLKLLCFFLLVTALPNLFLAYSQYLFHWPYIVPININASLKMDIDGQLIANTISGLFDHPNSLSVFLMPFTLLTFGTALYLVTNNIQKFLLFCIFFMLITMLYLTKVKGVWAWTLLGLFIILLPSKIFKSKNIWLGLVIAAILTTLLIIFGSLYLEGAFQTMLTRIQLWQSAFAAFENDAFIILFGSGQQDVWKQSALLSNLQYSNAHNTFINQIVNFGLPALILYVSAIVHSLKSATRSTLISDDKNILGVSKIVCASLIAMSGEFFFEPTAENSTLNALFFLYVAIASLLSDKRLSSS